MFHAKILCQTLGHSSFGDPHISFYFSHYQSVREIFVDCSPYTFNTSGVLLVAGLPKCGSLSIDSQPSLKHLCHTFICAALIASSAKALWIIQILSMEKCSSLMQNLKQICCSTDSIILNVMATQYTCSLNGVYHPHWLVQWSHHCSCMCIPVHSPWLPGYVDVTQTVLVILTMAEQTM